MTELLDLDVEQLDGSRTIPHSLSAEQATLGAMMLSPAVADEIIEIVSLQDFYDHRHATVYATITAQLALDEPTDPLSLMHALDSAGKLGKGRGQITGEYLHTLVASVPTPANGAYYAKIVREKAQLRQLIEAGIRITQLGYSAAAGSRDIHAAVDQAMQELTEASTASAGNADLETVDSWLDEVMIQLEAAREGKIPRGISTGFGDLDQLLKGGWKRKQLIIPAGRPGMGKSVIALGFAKAAARRGHRAVVFSTEMDRAELMMRLLSDVAEVPFYKIDSPDLTAAEARKLAEARRTIGRWPLHVYDTYVSPAQIRAISRRIAQRHGGVDLVVVDYLQRLEADKRQERRDLEVAEFARSMKTLAQQLDTTVIAPAQLNRESLHRVDKRPQLADLRESGALEQEADIVILLHRDDYYDKESPRRGEADLIVAKHRNGPTDTITVAAQLHFCRFVDMAH